MQQFYIYLCSFLVFFSFGLLIWVRYEREQKEKLLVIVSQVEYQNNTLSYSRFANQGSTPLTLIKCENVFLGSK